MDLSKLASSHQEACLDFIAGAPLVYHCHHFNLFLDQTIDDVLGAEAGQELRARVARDAWLQLLSGICDGAGLRTPAERLAACQWLFGAMGHGHVSVLADRNGGRAEGEYLHYGTAWNHKYGEIVRRQTPIDAVAAGFAAAATEVAYRTDQHFAGTEVDCVTLEDERCTFEVSGGAPDPDRVVLEGDVAFGTARTSVAEERISAINAGLRDFLSGVGGDNRGLVEAFGVLVTRHMTNYYNGISYGAVEEIRKRNPDFVPIVEELLRASGHVCVFNTFGGILYSPEWDALVGRVQGDLEEVISSCIAIARALGFGRWVIEELTPTRLVLSTHSEYEVTWCNTHGNEGKAPNYFIQGAGAALMRLATALDWQNRRPLNQDLYNELFRTGKNWVATQTHSLAAGDPVTRVVVEPG